MKFIILTIILAVVLLYLNLIYTLKRIKNEQCLIGNNIWGCILITYITFWILVCLFSKSYS